MAVTRETILYFSAPLSPGTMIDNGSFYATFGGQKILSRVELSSDRTKVSLFYLEPLPGSARVVVTVDASAIYDAAGVLVDADGDGVPGGIRDGAEVDQGTNPLDSMPVRTGVIATVKTPGAAIDVATSDAFAVTAEGTAGVSLFSLFDGSNPTMLAHVPITGNALRVACADNTVTVAADNGGLLIIDASTPAAAQVVHKVPLTGAQAVVAGGGTVWTGSSAGRIVAVDLRSGIQTATLKLSAAVADLALEGDFLYALAGNQVYVIALGDNSMTSVGSVKVPDSIGPNQRLFVGGAIGYTVHPLGYNTVDLSDPAKPILLTSGNSLQRGWKQIVLNGSGLGLAAVGPNFTDDGPHDISLYDVKDPRINEVFLTTLPTPGIARAVSIQNGLLYVADDTAGLEVINYLPYDNKGAAPSITLLPAFPTSGILEGKPVRASASVTDDVQVRNVEFYIDGVKAFVDGSFPFEFRFITPSITAGKTAFRLRARAVDTGGNSTWSDDLNVPLLPDTVPPHVIRVAPDLARRSVSTVLAFFDEPLDPASINPQSFQLFAAGADGVLGTADDLAITGGTVSYVAATRSASLNLPRFLAKDSAYRGVITTGVTDLAGNHSQSNFTWDFRTSDSVFSSSFEGSASAPAGSTLNDNAAIDTTGGLNNSGVLKLTDA